MLFHQGLFLQIEKKKDERERDHSKVKTLNFMNIKIMLLELLNLQSFLHCMCIYFKYFHRVLQAKGVQINTYQRHFIMRNTKPEMMFLQKLQVLLSSVSPPAGHLLSLHRAGNSAGQSGLENIHLIHPPIRPALSITHVKFNSSYVHVISQDTYTHRANQKPSMIRQEKAGQSDHLVGGQNLYLNSGAI